MAKLGDIASVVTKGTTPTSLGFAFENEGINFIKIESIEEDGSFIKEKFGHISEECDRALSRSRLQENDILFSIAGAIGRTAIVTSEILPANTNQALAIIRIPKGKIDYKFLVYALHSGAIVDQFEKKKQGVAQLNISLADVRSFQIPDISIQEQSRIVAILGKVDRLISLRKKQLQKLDDLVKSRFVEMFGDSVANPKGWKKEALSKNATLLNGRAYKQDELLDKGKYPVLRVGNFFSNRGWYYSDLELEDDKYCDNGDLLYAWSASFGPRIWNGGKVIYHYHIWKVLVGDSYNKLFLCKLLEHATESLMGETHGIAMMHLTKSGMEQTEFIVPPITLQKQFAEFYTQVNESKLTVHQGLDKLELLKQSLMQKYFG